MADTIQDEIETIAKAGIQSTSVDGVQVQYTPIKDLIEADKYVASKTAAASRRPGFRLFKFIPPGMT